MSSGVQLKQHVFLFFYSTNPPSRLLRPRGPTADVLRIFVKTGGPYDESSRKEQLVEVDFLIGGKQAYTSTQSWDGRTY